MSGPPPRKKTPSPQEQLFLEIMATHPLRFWASHDLARQFLDRSGLLDTARGAESVLLVRRTSHRARAVMHSLGKKGLVTVSPVGKPPGANELRARINEKGKMALDNTKPPQ
jgi:molybdenum cofactor biosynthesis enzyme MoaA